MLVTIDQLNDLQKKHPTAQFFVHSGYDGWSYGASLNPTIITQKTAFDLLNLIARRQKKNVLSELEREPSALLYADERDLLYRLTANNRFIAFLPIDRCSFRDEYDHPIHPPSNLTAVDFELDDVR